MASSPAFPIVLLLRRRMASSGPPSAALDLFEAELVARLKADPVLAPLVGDRVYPLAIPETPRPQPSGRKAISLPAIVYRVTANDRVRHLRGPGGVAYATVAIYCRAARYADAKAIREALRRYDGFAGILAEDVPVLFTWILDQADEIQWPAGLGGDAGTYDEALVLRFKFREPILFL